MEERAAKSSLAIEVYTPEQIEGIRKACKVRLHRLHVIVEKASQFRCFVDCT